MRPNDQDGGGLRATTPFRRVWCVDFEFRTPDGEPPVPVCLVAKEVFTGQVHRLWRDDLLTMRSLPFDTGPQTVVVSYHAPAEMGCLLERGWPLPENVIDLFAEHRVETNGVHLPMGNGLISALAIRGLCHHTSDAEKKDTVDLILRQSTYTAAEQKRILDYGETDVDALANLFCVMAPKLDWPRALLRGRYGRAVARMERNGIPIDHKMYRLFVHERERLLRSIIEVVDRQYGVYEDLTFKTARFEQRLQEWGMPWSRTETGRLKLDDDTFKRQAALFPFLEPLRELRQSISALRGSDLRIGTDGRAHHAVPVRVGDGQEPTFNYKIRVRLGTVDARRNQAAAGLCTGVH